MAGRVSKAGWLADIEVRVLDTRKVVRPKHKQREKGQVMVTVKLGELLYGDVTWHSREFTEYSEDEYGENYSTECGSFIDKAMSSRRVRRGRAHWYEFEATPEELSAVIDELVTVWIDDYEERADYSGDPEERKEYRDTVRKYRKFVAEYGQADRA